MAVSLTRKQAQAVANVTAYAAHLGLDLSPCRIERVSVGNETTDPATGKVDHMTEVYFCDVPDSFGAALDELVVKGTLNGPLPLAHAGFTQNYRQECAGCSLQVNYNPMTRRASLDIDPWNPDFGLGPMLLHIFGAVIPNALTKKDTDPFKMLKTLRKRGVDVPAL